MARPPKFLPDDILDAALAALVEHGPRATITDVSRVSGVSVGSMYHRHPSREHLFVALWLRSIRNFHAGLLATEAIDSPRDALLAQARHIPAWCRENPEQALALTLYRHRELVAHPPPGLEIDVREINDAVWNLGRTQIQALFGRIDDHLEQQVSLAIRQCPYGLVRPFIGSGRRVPDWLDDACVAAASAILDVIAAP